jgi:predicted class III extradiol MEMO1 family dioxygenase
MLRGRRFSYTFYTIVDPPSHAPGTVKNVTTFTVPIHSCIERLDREGMQLIERLDPHVFHDYLKRSRNTICGRHPISVLLWALNQLYVDPPQLGIDDGDDSDCATATTETLDDSRPAPSAGMRAAMATLLAGATPGHRETGPVIRFTRYAQSNRVKRPSESSVSYAAAYVYIPDGVKAHQLQLDQA